MKPDARFPKVLALLLIGILMGCGQDVAQTTEILPATPDPPSLLELGTEYALTAPVRFYEARVRQNERLLFAGACITPVEVVTDGATQWYTVQFGSERLFSTTQDLTYATIELREAKLRREADAETAQQAAYEAQRVAREQARREAQAQTRAAVESAKELRARAAAEAAAAAQPMAEREPQRIIERTFGDNGSYILTTTERDGTQDTKYYSRHNVEISKKDWDAIQPKSNRPPAFR